MFCLLRWWKAPFGVCLESLKLQYSTQNTSICIQEKNAVCALFSEVHCANKQDRHKDKSNTCEYTRAKENAMFIVALFSNKRTQKLFSAFFSMWEISLPSSGRTRDPVVNIKEVFFWFSPFFYFPFLLFHPPALLIRRGVFCLASINPNQAVSVTVVGHNHVDQAVVSTEKHCSRMNTNPFQSLLRFCNKRVHFF